MVERNSSQFCKITTSSSGLGAAKDIENKFDENFKLPEVPTWDDSQVTNPDEDDVVPHGRT
jgi:hypothetical protein